MFLALNWSRGSSRARIAVRTWLTFPIMCLDIIPGWARDGVCVLGASTYFTVRAFLTDSTSSIRVKVDRTESQSRCSGTFVVLRAWNTSGCSSKGYLASRTWRLYSQSYVCTEEAWGAHCAEGLACYGVGTWLACYHRVDSSFWVRAR